MSLNLNSPPSFEDAKRLRQQARATGLDPNHWYAVEEVRNIKPESVVEIVFWKHSIALFRTKTGSFHAVENRCAHRQIKLSLGSVDDCRLVCAYHGWQYDEDGRCVEIPHDRFGRGFPNSHCGDIRSRSATDWSGCFQATPKRRNGARYQTSRNSKVRSLGLACHWFSLGRHTIRW